MTDYIQTLEAQNLELRDRVSYLERVILNPNTHKEIWHCHRWCEDHLADKIYPFDILSFSPEDAFNYFNKEATSLFQQTDLNENSSNSIQVRYTEVKPGKFANQKRVWIHAEVKRGEKCIYHHPFGSIQDHPAFYLLEESLQLFRDMDIPIIKVGGDD